MKNSKKGVTLVELVICCAIIAMIGGACSAVIASGSTIFNKSTSAAHAQLDSDVLQNYMIGIMPSATNIAFHTAATMDDVNEYLYFDDDDRFIVRINGNDTSIRSVTKFEYAVVTAGLDGNARAQFIFKATLNDGTSLSGGYVMSNVRYTAVPDTIRTPVAGEPVYHDLALNPIVLNFPVPET